MRDLIGLGAYLLAIGFAAIGCFTPDGQAAAWAAVATLAVAYWALLGDG